MNVLAAAAIALALSSTPGERHLLDGARAFREARWAEALVEFRMAERLGERDAAAYAGAALVKLERWEEAIEAFARRAPGADALLDYYRAVALDGAGLHASADALLAEVAARGGPRLQAQAEALRGALAPRLASAGGAQAVLALRARCEALRREGRIGLAEATCGEAAALDRPVGPPRGGEAAAEGDPP